MLSKPLHNYAEINFVRCQRVETTVRNVRVCEWFINKCSGSGQVCSNSPFIQLLLTELITAGESIKAP